MFNCFLVALSRVRHLSRVLDCSRSSCLLTSETDARGGILKTARPTRDNESSGTDHLMGTTAGADSKLPPSAKCRLMRLAIRAFRTLITSDSAESWAV